MKVRYCDLVCLCLCPSLYHPIPCLLAVVFIFPGEPMTDVRVSERRSSKPSSPEANKEISTSSLPSISLLLSSSILPVLVVLHLSLSCFMPPLRSLLNPLPYVSYVQFFPDFPVIFFLLSRSSALVCSLSPLFFSFLPSPPFFFFSAFFLFCFVLVQKRFAHFSSFVFFSKNRTRKAFSDCSTSTLPQNKV